ncbi:MAG: sigma-70 family RNA polymerase sigma factor [Chloracidobacterium sp.]|uniref:Sigma-70 family RNA polymerase sigma factor n=1 Tax=Chloracidobacterium validum TaxID=2821543 RepID=A0ABX8B978_9BACT|nr:sigma-70 family RNA polymerase sigma factor [Chloracidobacterium validum]QUW02188.1 sigma-70 family RNA polymerase sigma factor [Chloracidobacterium validum]
MLPASELHLRFALDTTGIAAPETAQPLSIAEVELLDGIRAGSHAAFETLVTAHQKPIYNLLLRVLGDPEDAADVLQETFLSAYRGAQTFRGDCDIRTWLYRIAVNRAANHRRWWRCRRQASTVSLDAEPEDGQLSLSETLAAPDATPEQQALWRERQAQVLAALATLKFDFRVAVVMRDIRGMSYEDIASALELSMGTVKSRIARGREMLRAALNLPPRKESRS